MSTPSEEPRWLEPFSAILLGLAATLTAIAAYMSSVEGGDEDEARAGSIEETAKAYALTNIATQTRAADQAMFAAYAQSAFADTGEGLPEYLLGMMRPVLNEAVLAWTDTPDDGPDTPFEMAEYTVESEVEAEVARAAAEKHDAKAQAAAEKGDNYDKSTIYLALALFFAGIATTFRSRRYSGLLLSVSTIAVVVGAISAML